MATLPPDVDLDNSYDVTPYPSYSFVQSHPDRMAVLATLLGLKPAPVQSCRVLEIGCASGGNLLPQAYHLPGSEFVGVDYSRRQIAEGQARVEALGLRNLRLRHIDIRDIGPDLGQFDYIIAHGIYSWIPADVRDRLMAACRQNLAPQGIAYVSYATYPGGYMLRAMREMMQFHTRKEQSPAARAAGARELLDFLVRAVPADETAQGQVLNAYLVYLTVELERLRKNGDAYLLHDELSEVNEPVYFYEFVQHAERHGLQFLAESSFRAGPQDNFPPEVSEVLSRMAGSLVEMEQYYDFLIHRTLRRTLLCHGEQEVNRVIRADRIRDFYIASRTAPLSAEPDILGDGVEKYRGGDGATLSTNHPVSKAAMHLLSDAWPQPVRFDELLAAARARVYGASPPAQPEADAAVDAEVLGVNILRAYSYSQSLVQFHTYKPRLASLAGERPEVCRLARFQAGHDHDVTNAFHERVELEQPIWYLVPFLDGTRDRSALVELLMAGPVAQGALKLEKDGQPIQDPVQIRAVLADEVQNVLKALADYGLLVG